MSKHITYTYEGAEYDLEYTRKTAEAMERNGFNIGELTAKPVTMFPLLFAGAFIAHHKHVPLSLINKMFDEAPDKENLIMTLSDMYAATVNSLLDDDGKTKNGSWTVS